VGGDFVTQVELQSPATDDHWSGWTPPTERTVRRRRKIVLLVILIFIVVCVSWLYSYNPLQQSFNGPYSAGLIAVSGAKVHTVAVGHDVLSPSNSTLGREYLHAEAPPIAPPTVFWIEPAGRYSVNYEATITNRSPLSITIEDIFSPLTYPRGAHVRTYFYNANVQSGAGKPFHSVTLGAHDKVSVVVTFTQSCVPSATTTSSGDVTVMPVRYSMLGLSRTTTVPILPFGVQSRKFC
jgi:hypothetical protein